MKNSQILEIMKLLIDGCKWFRWAENAQFQHTANTRRHSGHGERWDPGHSCEGGLSKRWLACSARCTPFPAKTGPLRVSREGLDFVNNESLHTFFLFLVDGRERDVHADMRERDPASQCSPSITWCLGTQLGLAALAPSTFGYWAISLPTNETLDPKG